MNDTPNTTSVDPIAAIQMVEIFDENGNPTGQYRAAGEGEATSEETAFIATDDAVREVTVH